MRRCTRAGREHSQAASPRWPAEILPTIGIMPSLGMGVGWEVGTPFFREFDLSSVSSVSFAEFVNLVKFTTAAQGLAVQSVIGQREKLYCVLLVSHILLLLLFLFLIVFLNCLYLNPWSLLFVHSPPHPTVGGEE